MAGYRGAGPVEGCGAGVQGHVGGDVPGGVRHRGYLVAVLVAGERAGPVPAGGSVGGQVAVVHRERAPGPHRGDGVGPRRVPGRAHLSPVPVPLERPPPVQPGQFSRTGRRTHLLHALGIDQQAVRAALVQLDHRAGHGVQPLVTDQQPDHLSGEFATPVHTRDGHWRGEVHRTHPQPAGQITGGQLTHGAGQLTAARAQVHEVQLGRLAERGVDARQQLQEHLGELGPDQRSGAEVRGRPFSSREEPVRPVEALLPGVLPVPHGSTVTSSAP